jgi:N-glycosylase/DNA lyase
MSLKRFKKFCQWSNMGIKRTISSTIGKKNTSRFDFKTIVWAIGLVSGKRSVWPFPLPGPADYRGRPRRRCSGAVRRAER